MMNSNNTVADLATPVLLTKKGRIRATPFPFKLMKILSNPEYHDIITWLPDGKSFRIVDPKQFTAVILPIHFKEAKYSSFKRKLYRWGFQRHRTNEGYTNPKGNWYGSRETFYHEHFQQNRMDLVIRMKRFQNDGVQTAHLPVPPAGAIRREHEKVPMISHASRVPTASYPMMPTAPTNTFMSETSQFPFDLNNRLSTREVIMNAAIELEVNRRCQERRQVERALIAKQQRTRLLEQYLSRMKAQTNQRGGQRDVHQMNQRSIQYKLDQMRQRGMQYNESTKAFNQKFGSNIEGYENGAPLPRLPLVRNVIPKTA